MKRSWIISAMCALLLLLGITPSFASVINLPDGSITTSAGTYSSAFQFFDTAANPKSPDRWNIVASNLTFQGQVNIADINNKARWNTWDGGAGTNLGAWFMLGAYAGSGKGVWWTGVQWTGGGDAATDIRHIFHMQDVQGTQPDPKYYTQPYTASGGGWLNDWFNFKLVIHATSNTTGTAQLWINNDLVNGQGQIPQPPINTFSFDITGAANDLTNMRIITWMINGDNPNNLGYTLDWRNASIDGTPVPLPGTVLLLGSGLAGLAFYRKRRATVRKG